MAVEEVIPKALLFLIVRNTSLKVVLSTVFTKYSVTSAFMILIVDDEDQILKTLKMALDHQGVDARTAASAEEGWAEIRKKKPHLLLCDVNMPLADGFSLVEKVRKEPELADMKVLFMTGLPTREHAQQVKQLNAFGMIQKPFVLKQILEEVRKALSSAA